MPLRLGALISWLLLPASGVLSDSSQALESKSISQLSQRLPCASKSGSPGELMPGHIFNLRGTIGTSHKIIVVYSLFYHDINCINVRLVYLTTIGLSVTSARGLRLSQLHAVVCHTHCCMVMSMKWHHHTQLSVLLAYREQFCLKQC